MSPLGWALVVFGVWVAVVLAACALLGASQRKPTPSLRSDFSLWESEASSGTDRTGPSSTGPGRAS